MVLLNYNYDILKYQKRNILIPGIQYYYGEMFVTTIYNDRLIEDYAVSSYGRVYSFRWKRFLSQSPDKDGYLRVGIVIDGKNKTVKVHRLMLMSFTPIYNADKYQGNHEDGIKYHNFLFNLSWVKPIDNTRHAWDTGLNLNKGDGNIKSLLSEDQIHIICQCIKQNYTARQISEKLGIDYITHKSQMDALVSSVKTGKSFRHIASQYELENVYCDNKRYRLEFAYLVCPFLENGNYTLEEIMSFLDIDERDKRYFYNYICDLVGKRTAKEVTEYFPNIKRPKRNN